MPQRNSVPTLKLLCIRTIAWPDGLTRKGETTEPGLDLAKPSKMTLFGKLFGRKDKNKCKMDERDRVRLRKILSSLSLVDGLADAIVNAWIRITNYHGARVGRLQQMNRYLNLRISALDFLHEQSVLRGGLNLIEVGGLIPVTLVPQSITPESWMDIIDAIKRSSGNRKSMRCLLVSFASGHQSPTDFKFINTISTFPNLTKIVVTGSVDNSFMKAVGIHCSSLVHLDIRGCSLITDTGVLLLLFKRDPETVKSWLLSVLGSMSSHYPSNAVRPLAKTLQYFDMSTVPASDSSSLDISEIVIKACPMLVATPGRFFYYPGTPRLFVRHIELMPIQEIKIKTLSDVRCMCVDTMLIFVKMIRTNFQFGLTQVELRAEKPNSNECSVLFLYMSKVIVHLVVENLTVLSLTTFAPSVFDFVSLEVLAQSTPHLRHIKAPLIGQLTREHALPELRSVTTPLVHSVDTMKSLFLFCFQLEYVEVREMFISTNGQQLNDFNIHEMMLNGPYPALEVIRLLFINDVTLLTGVKEITFNCPSLRSLGDMKYWQAVPFNMLSKFLTNMSSHNFDFGFEFDGVLYSTSSVCPEFRI